MGFLIWLEQTSLSVWVRESPSLWAFPFILFLHTLGLAFVGGIAVAVNIWLLAFAREHPFAPLGQLLPVMWTGFTVNLVSGVLLLVAYPAKALTNPVFYVKLALVGFAMGEIEWLRKLALADRPASATLERTAGVAALASAALVAWGGAVFTGRFLAYTHRILLASEGF